MNKNDVYIEISRVLEEHINKYGNSLHYVTFPYLDGQFLEEIHVLTPVGQQTLQEYLDIRRRLLGESDDSE